MSNTDSARVGDDRPTLPRADAVKLIQRQFGWTTQDSAYVPNGRALAHYGLLELRELLDHIYGGIPANHDEKLCKGLTRKD